MIKLDTDMRKAAETLNFEKAIVLRDQIQEIQRSLMSKADDYQKNSKEYTIKNKGEVL